MSLPYYANALKTRPSNPKEHYLQQKQAQVDALWDISTQNNEIVLMQEEIGSNEYIEMPISVDTAIDLSTGFKKGDDYKIFSHKNISTNHAIGLMYQYANNYWITIDNSDLASAVSSIEVRRCNNKLKWIDKTNGAINEVPCVIDYELSSPSPQRDKDIIVANGHVVVICQSNELTESIEKNQRFIFNGQPFKLSAINNLHYDDIDVNLTPLMYLDLYLDIIEPDDDIINNIANKGEYDYQIIINNAPKQQTHDFSGQLVASAYRNGELIDVDMVWNANEFATVDEQGVFSLSGDIGDIAIITATIANNQAVTASVSIAIVDSVVDYYDIVMTPNITEIRQKQKISFILTLYKNGVATNDVVNATVVTGGQHVSLIKDIAENSYILSCNGLTSNNVILRFASDQYSTDKSISLKSFF